MSRFDENLPDVLKHEGGYVDHPRDPGGATNKGVILRTFRKFYGSGMTKQDLRNITQSQVSNIYRQGYWQPVHAEAMWVGLDRVAFDAAVNSGVSQSLKWVQRAVGVKGDGRWGPNTKAAVKNTSSITVIQKACANRMSMLRGLRHWNTFKNGWSRRVAEVEAKAVSEASGSSGIVRGQARRAKTAADTQQGGATAATGGSGIMWASDVPWQAVTALTVFLIIVSLVLYLKGRHNRNRAKAYEALEIEVNP